MKALRTQLKVLIGIPTPAWLVKFGASLIFKTDPDLALYGRYVISQRLAEEGFEFQFARLDDALKNLFGKGEEEEEVKKAV